MNKVIFICLLGIALIGCDKERLKPLEEGSPVYHISGKMDYLDWSIVGGYDRYFLFTDFRKEKEVYQFYSTFRQSDCNIDCKKSIKISFWDRESIDRSASVDIYQTLIPGDYQYDYFKDSERFSKVSVEWIDGQDRKYSSDAALQTDSTYFKIVSVKNYSDDYNGNPTVKVEVKFNVRLFNVEDTTDVVILNKAFGALGVAYPR